MVNNGHSEEDPENSRNEIFFKNDPRKELTNLLTNGVLLRNPEVKEILDKCYNVTMKEEEKNDSYFDLALKGLDDVFECYCSNDVIKFNEKVKKHFHLTQKDVRFTTKVKSIKDFYVVNSKSKPLYVVSWKCFSESCDDGRYNIYNNLNELIYSVFVKNYDRDKGVNDVIILVFSKNQEENIQTNYIKLRTNIEINPTKIAVGEYPISPESASNFGIPVTSTFKPHFDFVKGSIGYDGVESLYNTSKGKIDLLGEVITKAKTKDREF